MVNEEYKNTVLLLPEDCASQISDQQFEPGKAESLIYLKLVSITPKAIKAANHKVEDVFGPEKGYLIFSDCEILRKYLIDNINRFIDQAIIDAKKDV